MSLTSLHYINTISALCFFFFFNISNFESIKVSNERRNPKTKKLTSVRELSERSPTRVFSRRWSEGLGFVCLGVKESESVFTVRELGERSPTRVFYRQWVFYRRWCDGLGFVCLGVKESESVFW